MKKMIFIAGCGRSGTHLVGDLVASHSEVIGRTENTFTFKLITKIATSLDSLNLLILKFLKSVLIYRVKWTIRRYDSNILEKAHASIWLADFLFARLDNVFFICVWREPLPTVSSMLKHKGVLSWYYRLSENKVNRFLGISKDNLMFFKDLSIEEKCALKWLSHRNEIIQLREKYPQRTIEIKYEDLIENPNSIRSRLSEFLNVSNHFMCPMLQKQNLEKWKRFLSLEQVERIESIVELSKLNNDFDSISI